jgi:hypothetical protein
MEVLAAIRARADTEAEVRALYRERLNAIQRDAPRQFFLPKADFAP